MNRLVDHRKKEESIYLVLLVVKILLTIESDNVVNEFYYDERGVCTWNWRQPGKVHTHTPKCAWMVLVQALAPAQNRSSPTI
ncbi:hypothetical protein JZO81_14905 [Enterococcus hulanensis]|uniref:hypothetical protein n=1 Tax=Enterococcus TaxID=1350 RepID=UPI000B5AB44D|nr:MULTISPECIES: hypothetical protein [Enterococcus]MBO0412359.1 hypothetical protein [Enterococcus hulanensis]OTO20291.1 hypothetical protein A5875_001641 [Enterococcus sp. 3H8_DIV0648]